jgi:hypothetical protein
MEIPLEHFVSMPNSPERLPFPPDLSDRIRYDTTGRRLVYDGFMSKTDFDRLCRVSDDWGYRRALEDLFRLCTPEERKRPVLARLFSLFSLGV